MYDSAEIRLTLALPGRIVEHNADRVEGNQLTWTVPVEVDHNELYAVSEPLDVPGSGSRPGRLVAWAIAGASVGGALLGAILVLHRRPLAAAEGGPQRRGPRPTPARADRPTGRACRPRARRRHRPSHRHRAALHPAGGDHPAVDPPGSRAGAGRSARRLRPLGQVCPAELDEPGAAEAGVVAGVHHLHRQRHQPLMVATYAVMSAPGSSSSSGPS